MELKGVRVRPSSPECRVVKSLLKSQIPEDERMPFAVLRLGTLLTKRCDCTCFYEGSTPVGFYYLLLSEKAVFMLYLVVSPDVQSRGYGSAILEKIRKRYPDCQVDLHIEIPKDPESKDEQAAKRYRFYQRNGFLYTGWTTEDGGVRYWILSSRGPAFDTEKHKEFLSRDRNSGTVVFNHEGGM
jgi:GNAT superfamily N-acetyltransferase